MVVIKVFLYKITWGEANMNKIELIKATLAGEKCKVVPYAMWSHMPAVDRDPKKNAEATYNFYKEYDVDIVKTMNNGMYSIEDYGCKIDYSAIPTGGVAKIVATPIHSGEDWKKIAEIPINEGALLREQEYLRLLLEKLRNENVPVVFTIFSPVTTANKLCGNKLLEYVKEGYGKDIHATLEKITATTVKLVEKVIAMGADGVFFATQMSSFAVSTEEFYAEYGAPYDKKVLNASKGWCNILHAHGDDIMFDILKDYPVQIFNWHAWQSLPTIEEGQKFSGKTIMCGIERYDITEHHKNKLRNEIYNTLKANNGKHLILAPGCVIRYPLDKEMLSYVKRVKEESEKVLFGNN